MKLYAKLLYTILNYLNLFVRVSSISCSNSFKLYSKSLSVRQKGVYILCVNNTSCFVANSGHSGTEIRGFVFRHNPSSYTPKIRSFPKVKVRFAPSPTGDLHVGNLRTFIYNYLFALKHDGTVILRVDDTDISREIPGSIDRIVGDFKWLGFKWSKGPGSSAADNDSYYQSNRQHAYKEVAELLLQTGKAYRCFCSKEDVERRRKNSEEDNSQITYDKTCSHVTSEGVEVALKSGRKYTVRLRSPPNEEDFIILRSDGTATYNFACAVDDHEFGITHVIRAVDHLDNTYKQIQVLQAIGTAIPAYKHCSLLRNLDLSKISKRDNDCLKLSKLRTMGFSKLPIINYLAFLGTRYADDPMCYDLKTLSQKIELDDLSFAPIAFNIDKLKWLNKRYLTTIGYKDFTAQLKEYIDNGYSGTLLFPKDDFMGIVETSPHFLKNGVHTLYDYVVMMESALGYKPPAFVAAGHCGYGGVFLDAESQRFLETFIEWAQQLISASDVGESIYKLARDMFNSDEFLAIGGKQHLPVVRYALTGTTTGPPISTLIDLWSMAAEKMLPGFVSLRERIVRMRDIDLRSPDPLSKMLFETEPKLSNIEY
ncbi:putative glutamyl-tRNA synthetase [Babesia bovis T2Bo]|uniref:putative glutamyl-tRNA synthetase n=1 Tax=Babesia bovis T2Bo TaxID=484906 RepID=UPI001D82E580|nr:putative glutamyl-tRNA synthetase [Babesia bovis T2Bo]EDO07417.2 putative glutamyl-tRNA synthetase [Babesia bovis T2Bo]